MIAWKYSPKKPFVARMRKSVVRNLPEPVVIIHELGEEGDLDTEKKSLTLSPKEKVGNYGNLIDATTRIRKIEDIEDIPTSTTDIPTSTSDIDDSIPYE